MEPDQKYAAVGLFVLLGLAGLVVMGLWLNGALARQNTQCFVMRFDGSVGGLSQGSTITYRGVGVGTVERIRINPQNDAQILVRALLVDNTPIHPNTVAQLKPQGVTGASYIELDLMEGETRTGTPAKRAEGCRIIATRPSGIAQIVSTLPQILDKAMQVADRLSAVLDTSNTAHISAALANLNTLTATLSSQSQAVGPDLRDAAQALRASMDNLNRMTHALENNAQGNVQALQATVRETGAAMREIKTLAEELRRNPRRLILTPEVREERVPQ